MRFEELVHLSKISHTWELIENRNLVWTPRGKTFLILISTTVKSWPIDPRSLKKFQLEVSGKVTTGITGLWRPSLHSDIGFDPSMSALLSEVSMCRIYWNPRCPGPRRGPRGPMGKSLLDLIFSTSANCETWHIDERSGPNRATAPNVGL